jgi:hypothetical protein
LLCSSWADSEGISVLIPCSGETSVFSSLSAVESIGIYIIDGKDGPFRLEVDWIRAYRKDAHRKNAHREAE